MALKKYWSLAVCSMQNTLSYRLAFVLSFLGNFVTLVAMYYLWQSIYAGQTEIAGFQWNQMKAYLLVTFFVNSMLSYYSESGITGKVIDGTVAMDLLKPLDFQKARLAESLGSCVLEGLLSAVLTGILAVTALGVPLPQGGVTALLFTVSLLSSILVKFGIVYCAALVCFYTTSGIGVIWARMAVTNLLSGALVPLAFFPGWLRSVAMVLPFQGIVNTPSTIFLGMHTASEALGLIALQWFWIVALWLLGKWMWGWAVRQITIHGG
ncbi:ABC-2 family transporter protein [Paenibacillus sp. HN-1]|uniref:ABC transporter permease n=1 Tax=Paenibacillus TaxID=44249 RepID=UPI001CAA173D|nr:MULTISPECIES: ABC-2 family transporter protein [Paenibacillus]MBY9080104.1 ABC-2 family transporter protein [Paenibacillus sp. CGMCC 1.18879]MBY9086802.1 ABC-2 family transporter protein [Paenibacillus sinensis]